MSAERPTKSKARPSLGLVPSSVQELCLRLLHVPREIFPLTFTARSESDAKIPAPRSLDCKGFAWPPDSIMRTRRTTCSADEKFKTLSWSSHTLIPNVVQRVTC